MTVRDVVEGVRRRLDLYQGILLVNSRFAVLLTKVVAAPDSRDSQQVLIFIASLYPSLTKWVALVRVSCSLAQVSWLMFAAGWLFLFSVLMAAGLLFTMVFFVSLPLILIPIRPPTHSHTFRSPRSSCSQTLNAIISIP